MSTAERFASGVWLRPPLVTFIAAFMLAGSVIALGALLVTAHGKLDWLGRPLGTDFSSFWTAGRMAIEGHAAQAYDWAAHARFQRQTFGVDLFFPWSYPPIFLLVAAALATLPYVPAVLLWDAATLLMALAVFRRILRSRQALLTALGSPVVLVCLGNSQTGFLTAALLAGGLLALPKREYLAGVLFGLAAYKPQFGLLLPFVLIAGRHWRAFIAAALTVMMSVAVTLVLWGWPIWRAFLESIPLTRAIVLEQGDTGFGKFQSAFSMTRMWGGSAELAYAVQGLVTAAVLVACVAIWRSQVSFRLKAAALLCGALLSSPYVVDYDMVTFGMALAFMAAHGIERGFLPWEKTMLACGWLAPLISRSVGMLYLPVGFAALAAAFILIVIRARHDLTAAAAVVTPQGGGLPEPLGAGAPS